MSKVMIIERCGDCPFMRWSGAKTICGLNNEEIDPLSPDFDKFEAGRGMPDWCPLSDAPEKLLAWHDDDRDDYATGRNDCLKALEGGSDD